jgi:hypothetical protein
LVKVLAAALIFSGVYLVNFGMSHSLKRLFQKAPYQ